MGSENGCRIQENDELWQQLRYEAKRDADAEPALASYLQATILFHRTMEQALAFHLSNKLSSSILPSLLFYNLVVDIFMQDPEIRDAIRIDMRAVKEKDPACLSYCHCLLNFKGFLACQAQRVAHRLWSRGRIPLALVIQSRVSEVFAMDIHPAAKIGKGVLFDHGTGVVIGETASIGDNVSILHMRAVREKDPACDSYCHCLLNFKGFLACQAHRVAHRLWSQGRIPVALAIQSRVSEVFAMVIHPEAKIGKGVLFDHGNGVVIGDNV